MTVKSETGGELELGAGAWSGPSGNRVTRDFDMDLLRTFVTIVDLGGFTRAADRLGRTQSTISLQVKRLEEGIGRRLFHRRGRGVTLAPDGEALLTYAREILRLNDEARVRLAEPDIEGHALIGVDEDFATSHLMAVLAKFAELYPNIQLTMICDASYRLMEGFARQQYEVVLFRRYQADGASAPLMTSLDVTGAQWITVWRDSLVWVAGEGKAPRQDRALDLVLPPAPDPLRQRVEQALEAAGRAARVAITCDSGGTLQSAVRSGLGIGIMPRDLVPSSLRILGIDHGLPRLGELQMVLCRAERLSRAADRLAEHIVRNLDAAQRAPLSGT